MIERHINKINVNPFLGGLIIQAFHHGFKKDKCPLVAHYLILPLIMYADTREVLENINSRNSLYNVIQSNNLAFSDLQNNVWSLKKLTNLALINLHTQKKITVKSEVEIHETLDYNKTNSELKQYLRAANYLGVLLEKENTQNIFKHLKVIP